MVDSQLAFLEKELSLIEDTQTVKTVEFWNSCIKQATKGKVLSDKQWNVIDSIFKNAYNKANPPAPAPTASMSNYSRSTGIKELTRFFDNALGHHEILAGMDQFDNDY